MSNEKKLFVGPRIRRLRRDLGLTQVRMAEELGISASYLNLIERNQRPVSAQILLKLAEVYDIEIRSLAGDDEARAMAELNEVFSDPLFMNAGVTREDIREVATASPAASEAIAALYRAYQEVSANTTPIDAEMADREGRETETVRFPVEEVRDFIQGHKNYFPALDEAAEELHAALDLARDEPYGGLSRYLKDKHEVEVRLMPADVMSYSLRRFDRHRRRLMLSELLEPSGRSFQLAYQIALFEQKELMNQIVADSGLQGPEVQRMCRVSLANYFAGALLMPYERFQSAAEELGYDIEFLGRRFSTSFEQTCHRLTTMQRPGARGIPFFLVRVDSAGNISKRFSPGAFHFSKFGGTCPRWNVHDAFRVPGQIYTQLIQLPDNTTYFSIARTVTRAGSSYQEPDQQLAIGLGCEASYAGRLVYAQGYDLDELTGVTPIGVNCRLCERADCGQRAFPPLNRRLLVDETTRSLSPFTFALE